MIQLNTVILAGRLTRTPEFIQPGNKIGFTTFNLAVNRGSGDAQQTLFVEVICFDKTSAFANEYLEKASAIVVQGRLNMRSWTDSAGMMRSKLNIIAERIQFALPKPAEPQPALATAQDTAAPSEGDDVPVPQDPLPF